MMTPSLKLTKTNLVNFKALLSRYHMQNLKANGQANHEIWVSGFQYQKEPKWWRHHQNWQKLIMSTSRHYCQGVTCQIWRQTEKTIRRYRFLKNRPSHDVTSLKTIDWWRKKDNGVSILQLKYSLPRSSTRYFHLSTCYFSLLLVTYSLLLVTSCYFLLLLVTSRYFLLLLVTSCSSF